MRMDFFLQNMPPSEALEQHAADKVRHAAEHFERRVEHVTVRLTDHNGPRGGADKCCTVEAHVLPHGAVVVRQRAEDPYEAVSRASKRLKTLLGRRFGRQRRGRDSLRWGTA